MPVSVSDRQHRFMMAIAHSAKFSAQTGVPMSVGQKFLEKDKAACYPMKDKSKCTGSTEAPDNYNKPKSRQRTSRKFDGIDQLFSEDSDMRSAGVRSLDGVQKGCGPKKKRKLTKYEQMVLKSLKGAGVRALDGTAPAVVLKYNKNHGPDGRFTTSGGGMRWVSSNRYEFQLRQDEIDSIPHSGAADDAVEALATNPDVRARMAHIKPEDLASELKEYGAWDDKELGDHEANVRRALWVGALDVRDRDVEEGRMYAGGTPDFYKQNPGEEFTGKKKTRKMEAVFKFNPNHDPKTGRFTTARGGGGSAEASTYMERGKPVKPAKGVQDDALMRAFRDAQTDPENMTEEVYRERDLNFLSDKDYSADEWTDLMQRATPGGYNAFAAGDAGKVLSKYPGIKIRPGREYSPVAYVTGDRNTLARMARELQGNKDLLAEEIDLYEPGHAVRDYSKASQVKDLKDLPAKHIFSDSVLRLWWD